MENKINYYEISRDILKEVDALKDKPTLLLHVCCGPCSTFPLRDLCPHFKVVIYYNNSNIFPESEYNRRLEELKKFLTYFKKDYGYDVPLIVPPYDNEEYTKTTLEPLKDFGEFSIRCFACYERRMDEAYRYADQNGFDYFTTVMSISRYKNAQKMNEIGEKLSHKYKTKYFFSDFKKNKGQDIAREMRIFYNLYSQDYCGCLYSYNESLERKKKHA